MIRSTIHDPQARIRIQSGSTRELSLQNDLLQRLTLDVAGHHTTDAHISAQYTRITSTGRWAVAPLPHHAGVEA